MKSKTVFKAVLTSFILLCLLAFSAEAQSYRATLEKYPAGDSDLDGTVSSGDARSILRISVHLDQPDKLVMLLTDTNGSGTVDAEDARKALRVSVSLELPHYHSFVYTDQKTGAYRCTGCLCTYTEEPCVHDYSLSMVTRQPTCKTEGQKNYTCRYCGATKTETLPKLATHSFDGGTLTQPATCKSAGVKTRTCSVCGFRETETLPKLTAHAYDKGIVTAEPTCKTEGKKTYTCRNCGNKKTETLPKLAAHSFDGGTLTQPATCKSAGVYTYVCTVCGTKRNVSTSKTASHVYGSAVLTVQPTCLAEGILTYTCTVCGEKKTETIPMTGHDYETVAAGISKCRLCGDTVIGDNVGAFSIELGGKTLFMGEELSMLTKDFGRYSRTDRNFIGLTAYSFTNDYSTYFIAFCNGSRTVGYYICADDFTTSVYSRGDKNAYTTKYCSGNSVSVTPYSDRVKSTGVYAILVMSQTYNLIPDTGADGYLQQTARQIFDITNAYRLQNGASQLTWSDDIAVVAESHSRNMADHNYLEHIDTDGCHPWERAEKAGIDYLFYSENIAGGSEYSYLTVDQWINSRSHNDGLLSASKLLGVGGAYNADSKFEYYWTQNFAELCR